MAKLTGSSTAEIDAPLAQVWDLVQNVESAPDWQGGLKGVWAVERQWRGTERSTGSDDGLVDGRLGDRAHAPGVPFGSTGSIVGVGVEPARGECQHGLGGGDGRIHRA